VNETENAGSEERYVVPAVEQACRILFHLAGADSGRMSLKDICAQVGIHKSKAFSVLQTLQKFGLVQTGGRGKGYTLGPGLIGLSRRFLDTLSAPKLAEPLLADLSRKTGATAVLGLIAGKNVFVAAKNEGEGAIVVTMRVGHRFPLTYGCHGKAVAAFLNRKDLDNLLRDKKLYFQGNPAKFDRKRLMDDIERCRREWFAEDFEETAPGRCAVASPVLGPNGYPIGYILLIGLATAEAARKFGPLVGAAAQALSKQLGATVELSKGSDQSGNGDEP
jgi:DNA-binding IclR family transcriptional regulator